MAASPAAAQVACAVSTQGVNFGNYSSRSSVPADSTGNIQTSCSGPSGQAVLYIIALSSGAAGSFFPRKMNGNAGTLSYNLYTEATRSTIWGVGNAGTSTVADSYSLAAATVTRNYAVYGRLFSGQNANIGSYVDSITVTVSY